jgi:hypothetical protein
MHSIRKRFVLEDLHGLAVISNARRLDPASAMVAVVIVISSTDKASRAH